MHFQYGALPCSDCQSRDAAPTKAPEFYHMSKMERVQEDRDTHERDMIQPLVNGKVNPDFVKAFPAHSKEYFTKEELKDI